MSPSDWRILSESEYVRNPEAKDRIRNINPEVEGTASRHRAVAGIRVVKGYARNLRSTVSQTDKGCRIRNRVVRKIQFFEVL